MKNTIELKCDSCGVLFERTKGQHRFNLEDRKQTNVFCSNKCVGTFAKKQRKQFVCAFCDSTFSKHNSKRNPPKFCSRSCSSKQNGLNKKGTLSKKCEVCNTLIDSRRKYCDECFKREKRVDIINTTIGEYLKTYKARNISSQAKAVTKNREQICSHCGYDKFVEVCHIKAVSSFPPFSTLAEVNAPDNLILLCPNCHWEFDHGMLKIAGVDNIQPTTSRKGGPKITYLQKLKQCYCCADCGINISYRSKRCRSCAAKKHAKRKVENRPPKEELLKMIADSSFVAVGRKFEVSDNAVRKWLKAP